MKKSIIPTIFLMFVLLGLIACSRSERKEATDHTEAKPAAREAAEGAGSILKIEESMLRDLRIITARVEQHSAGETTAMIGELTVNENAYAEVGSPIASKVVSVTASPGQSVKIGQVVAILQSPEVGKARSEMLTAQARLDLARRVLERKRRLGAERIVAQRDIQEAEANQASAEAELRAARGTLESLGVDQSETLATESPRFSLRSPISGTVIERNAVQGRMAEPAQPLFRIGDLSHLWLTVHAFEGDAVRVRLGTAARVTFLALPGQTFTGKVSLVGKQVDLETRTIPVRVEIANKGGLLRPGMSATAFLKMGNESGTILAVPVASLQRVGERWIVFIPRSEDSFETREVGRGRDLGSEVEILSGLKAGETVVVDGSFLLKAQAERTRGGGEDHD
jgi:cobalt-zinc-cadmium efflux system membrane fusion protein